MDRIESEMAEADGSQAALGGLVAPSSSSIALGSDQEVSAAPSPLNTMSGLGAKVSEASNTSDRGGVDDSILGSLVVSGFTNGAEEFTAVPSSSSVALGSQRHVLAALGTIDRDGIHDSISSPFVVSSTTIESPTLTNYMDTNFDFTQLHGGPIAGEPIIEEHTYAPWASIPWVVEEFPRPPRYTEEEFAAILDARLSRDYPIDFDYESLISPPSESLAPSTVDSEMTGSEKSSEGSVRGDMSSLPEARNQSSETPVSVEAPQATTPLVFSTPADSLSTTAQGPMDTLQAPYPQHGVTSRQTFSTPSPTQDAHNFEVSRERMCRSEQWYEQEFFNGRNPHAFVLGDEPDDEEGDFPVGFTGGMGAIERGRIYTPGLGWEGNDIGVVGVEENEVQGISEENKDDLEGEQSGGTKAAESETSQYADKVEQLEREWKKFMTT